jgi:hypothetical protein
MRLLKDKNSQQVNEVTTWAKVYAVYFLLGIWLTIREMNIYEKTLIPLYIPLSIWILTGLLITPLLYKFINHSVFTSTYSTHSTFVLVLVQTIGNMCGAGGLIVYIFMLVNFTFCKPETVTKTYAINSFYHTRYGYSGTNHSGYAELVINGMDKQILFSSDVQIKDYKAVQLTMSKGFFGFEVIKNKEWLK